MSKYVYPIAIILGIAFAFFYVFRDKANPLSRWVSGGRAAPTLVGTLPDSGNPQS